MTCNRSICHDFFYSGFDKTRVISGYNIWYEDNVIFSYGTAIGFVVDDKQGNKVFLLSDYRMSATTGKHIAHLRHACPYPVVYVPMEWGHKYPSVEKVATDFLENLRYYSGKKMTLAENRNAFIECFENTREFSNRVLTINDLIQFENLYFKLTNSEEVKKLKEEQRAKDVEKRKMAKKELEELLKTKSYLELVEFAYCDYRPNEMALKVRKVLNPENNHSFIWLDNNHYRTSQGITMPKAVGDVALNRWKDGLLEIGEKLGIYTVLKITKDFVKIGCHTIPTKNLEALLA